MAAARDRAEEAKSVFKVHTAYCNVLHRIATYFNILLYGIAVTYCTSL